MKQSRDFRWHADAELRRMRREADFLYRAGFSRQEAEQRREIALVALYLRRVRRQAKEQDTPAPTQ